MATEQHTGYGGGLRQIGIIALLVGALMLLHRFAVPPETGFDPTAMLAFGFVVLASYAVGQLAEALRLPHITGYLIAGVLLGPSIPAFLPEAWRLPPFDAGVLNESVLGQLGLVDALAVALIALTAGGELKLEGLRRGLGGISGVLAGQTLLLLVVVTAFVWGISGALPAMALPGLSGLDTPAVLTIGAAVAMICLATSPAATIAVINATSAEGPMSRNVLSTVVLKDVVVLVGFAIASTLAARSIGQAAADLSLGRFLLSHVLGSIAVGVLLGSILSLYLRYVGQELLLFLVGIVYLATFVARGLHLDPVLLFLAAGFTASNFSRKGDTLIHSVERLSMPVYVVFFTLAGARLHLQQLSVVAPFALALVVLRVVAIWVGVRAGARLGGTDDATARFGWLGFVSQAGVAISLTGALGSSLGEPGQVLATVLLATIALNELLGPVLLKLGLGLAGELRSPSSEPEPTSEQTEETGGARPARRGGEETSKRTAAPAALTRGEPTQEWKERDEGADVWGGRPSTSSRRLSERLFDLQADLQAVIRDATQGPLEEFRRESEMYLRELRREFLRHHRRVVVQARKDVGEGGEDPAKARTELAARLRSEQAELAERWRGIVLGRAARLRRARWTPEDIVTQVDRLVEGLPATVEAPWEPESFMHRPEEGLGRTLRRSWLRLRRGTHQLLGSEMPPREVAVRMLARYHLSGRAPPRLEGLATLLVQADQHLTSRTRSVFEAIVESYDDLAARISDTGVDPNEELVQIHKDVEEELSLAFDEIARIMRDSNRRLNTVLGEGVRSVKEEVGTFGTLDLPERTRRPGRVHRQRVRALDTVTHSLQQVRRATAAGYSRLAMELELVGVEARIKDALAEHISRLEGDVRGRARVQVQRVEGALREALGQLDETLASGSTGVAMAASIRKIAETVDKVVGEASRAATQLRDQLADERTGSTLLDALGRAVRSLTDRYEISGRLPRGEWKLPVAQPPVEVPFRELVTAYIDTQVAPKLLARTREMAEKVQPLANSLSELERLIAFNVELATGELEVIHEDSVPDKTRSLLRDMVGGALERSLSTVEGHVETAEHWPEELGEGIRESVLGAIESLRGQLVDGEISKARVDAMRRSAASRRIIRGAGELPGRLSRARRDARSAVRGLLGEQRLEDWRSRLGLPQAAERPQQDAEAFALPATTDQLPLVYRRLFAPDTLEAADVLTGRDPDIARARHVLAGGFPGRLRSAVLVGPDGVGKAAVSSAIVRARAWKNVRRVNLTRPTSVQDVQELFKGKAEGHLVVVDGLHWMLAMRPGGFEPLRRFVDGVIADGGRNAWLVHADLLFWRYASQVAPLEEAFPELVRLDPLGPGELQSAVLARHGLSGYGITFQPQRTGSSLERAMLRLAGRFRRPYEHYFRELHAASGGLVRDALRLWLASIEQVDEHDFVHVGPVPRSPAAALRRLPDELLLNLYLIARQGWMDADVQAWLFRVDRSTADAQLARLAHMRLLELHDGGVYRIAVHLRGQVVHVLREKGWVE
jgi:Kef-type K+ transport system membrane component KefB